METYYQIKAVMAALAIAAVFSKFLNSAEKRWKEHRELKKKLDSDIFSEACKQISSRE
jgi:hypothetical protein